MPRKKLSEYRSKQIICNALEIPYTAWSVTGSSPYDISGIDTHPSYVVKVDQAVKGRFKKGLVLLDVKKSQISSALNELAGKGYTSFLIEPYKKHKDMDERYISIEQHRDGLFVACSPKGGVDIEMNKESIKKFHISDDFNYDELATYSKLSVPKLRALIKVFQDNFFVFLEINPYIIEGNAVTILDSAVEVDDTGQYFTKSWQEKDIREVTMRLTPQEKIVRDLNRGSAASFNLSVINPHGSIFLLLSGGGASVVIADDIYNKGFGNKLANYGEYSGNPNLYETYKYTTQLLELILASDAPKKMLFVGGAVANFTDIATTFAGIIDAIDKKADQLKDEDLTVYVRRGGPNQEKGLKSIEECLKRHNIFGGVYGPSLTINDALDEALKGLKS